MKYTIEFSVTGHGSVHIEADSEIEAIEKFEKMPVLQNESLEFQDPEIGSVQEFHCDLCLDSGMIIADAENDGGYDARCPKGCLTPEEKGE